MAPGASGLVTPSPAHPHPAVLIAVQEAAQQIAPVAILQDQQPLLGNSMDDMQQ